MRQVMACAAMVWMVFVSASHGQTPGFYLVGNAAGTGGSRVTGVSSDGRVAVGWSGLGVRTPGFTWTQGGGRNDFGLASELPSQTFANAISGDATTVVGASQTVAGGVTTAYRYRGPGTFQSLGNLPGLPFSNAASVSGDGSVVVGRSETEFGNTGEAFRWTESGGLQGLGYTRPGHIHSEATGVSRDGRTIVGTSMSAGGFTDAFVWTESGGMRILPQLPGTTNPLSYAYGVNFDGSIVVGASGNQRVATMWRTGQPVELGVVAGFFRSAAFAASDDGSVAVGTMTSSSAGAAAVWTTDGGAELLSEYLARNRVSVPSNWQLIAGLGVSSDGTTIVGVAHSDLGSQGFVAVIPSPTVATSAVLALAVGMTRRRRS